MYIKKLEELNEYRSNLKPTCLINHTQIGGKMALCVLLTAYK
jgi:hypothetical protein